MSPMCWDDSSDQSAFPKGSGDADRCARVHHLDGYLVYLAFRLADRRTECCLGDLVYLVADSRSPQVGFL
jgi:hypothetical protein